MTSTQLAQAECANWDAGRCLGVVCGADLSAHPLPLAKRSYSDHVPAVCPKVACDVTEKRCGYFEECVLPMADSDHPDAPGYKTARAAYRAKHGMKQTEEDIRRCQCGEALGKRQRVCAKCLSMNRKESSRNSRIERRSLAIFGPGMPTGGLSVANAH